MSIFNWFKSGSSASTVPASVAPSVAPVAHTDNYKIVVVLDESGSMESIRADMLKSLNSLILEQKQVNVRDCNFTLVKFNHAVRRMIENKPLDLVNLLTTEDYTPNGTTALFDAIGETIDAFRYERDVLMVIITDGQENASKQYTKVKVMDMIKEKEKFAGWTYVYLSCNLQTAAQGASIGLLKSETCANCTVDQALYGGYVNTISKAISKHRTTGESVQSQLND